MYVKGLTDVYVGSEMEVYKVMRAGSSSRATSSTSEFIVWMVSYLRTREASSSNADMNAESSRSHSIFVIGIHQRNVETGSQKSGNLYLVDLAGSEKVCDGHTHIRHVKRDRKLTVHRSERLARPDKHWKRPRKLTRVYQLWEWS